MGPSTLHEQKANVPDTRIRSAILHGLHGDPEERQRELLKAEPDWSLARPKPLLKAAVSSNQSTSLDVKGLPFSFKEVLNFKDQNSHHSTCVETRKSSICGLGLEDEGVEEKLDELCEVSWQDVLNDAIEDYVQTGNGYIEVVRSEGDQIVGLHHIPCCDPRLVVEQAQPLEYHYQVIGVGGPTLHFARFGDRARLEAELGIPVRSEVIHLRRSNSRSRWYGYPDWLAAVISVEIVRMSDQHTFDFYLNRGVPELILFLLHAQLSDKEWEAVEARLKAQVGTGNSRKSIAMNLPHRELTVQLEKLALAQKEDGSAFSELNDALAFRIVSAWRTPPLLAGIQVPGKLGSVNEMPQALMSYQILVIGPEQKSLGRQLGNTLGKALGLKSDAFTWKKITDEIHPQVMDTLARMRDPVGGADGQARDLTEGVLRDGRK